MAGVVVLADPQLAADVDRSAEQLWTLVAGIEAVLDDGVLSGIELEQTNAALVRVRDAVWSIQRDRLRTARLVGELAGPGAGRAAVEAYTSIQVALSALDRLEVRGRDSAGLHLLRADHGLDLESTEVRALLGDRRRDHLFRSGAVRTPDGLLSLVYKAAAEIGELGDNTRALRAAIAGDELLRAALRSPDAEVIVLGHTRWASVGIVSQANAHPLNSEEEGVGARAGDERPYVIGALNGDVDNHADLKAAHGLRIAADVTTDAKVIPTIVSRRLADGADLVEAFRSTVASFEGSVAIAAQATEDPDQVLLALHGSGQALYVGLAEDTLRRRLRAVRARRGDRRLPQDGRRDTGRRGEPDGVTRDRSSPSIGAGPASSTASRASPTTARRCRSPSPSSPGRRSPPATSTAASTRTSC